MGDEEQKSPPPSLEPPRLFGRKKAKRAPVPSPADEVVEAPSPAPAPPVEESVVDPADDAATTVFEADEPTRVDVPVQGEQPPVVVEQPVRETVPAAPVAEPPAPLFVDEVQDTDTSTGATAATPVKPAKTPKQAKPPRPAKVKAPREPRPDRRQVPGRIAAAVTGLVVGLALVAATAVALRGCEAVQGTATCGNAGYPLLLVVLIIGVVLGSALLRFFAVPDPGSTSFLAVGLLAVVALIVLIEVIDSWWMVIVIPVVGALTYLLSYWVTTTFIEPAEH